MHTHNVDPSLLESVSSNLHSLSNMIPVMSRSLGSWRVSLHRGIGTGAFSSALARSLGHPFRLAAHVLEKLAEPTSAEYRRCRECSSQSRHVNLLSIHQRKETP